LKIIYSLTEQRYGGLRFPSQHPGRLHGIVCQETTADEDVVMAACAKRLPQLKSEIVPPKLILFSLYMREMGTGELT